jgi:hypothetical protein
MDVLSDWPDLNGFLDILEEVDEPELDLPEGFVLSSEVPETTPAPMAGPLEGPALPEEELQPEVSAPVPEPMPAQPETPKAPKPSAGAGPPDGLSQLTQTRQPAAEDSRADSLFGD